MEKSKKKTIIISSITGIILIAVIIAILLLNMTRLQVVDNFTIEYGNKISNNVADYVLENTDEKIVNNVTVEIVGLDELSEYPAIGDYVVRVKYKNQVKNVIVTVKDTTKPAFVNFNKDINIYTGEKVNWNTLFVVDDLSETTISVDDTSVDYSVAGTYQITVTATDTSNNSISENANLNIIQTSLSINASNVSVKKGNTYQLQTTVVGRDQSVKYSSSNTSVATVDENGKIVGVGKGTATITVEANGLFVTCEVTVTNNNSSSNKNNSSSNQSSNTTPPADDSDDNSGDGSSFAAQFGGSQVEGNPEDHKSDYESNSDWIIP